MLANLKNTKVGFISLQGLACMLLLTVVAITVITFLGAPVGVDAIIAAIAFMSVVGIALCDLEEK